jgi:hypothetical protein
LEEIKNFSKNFFSQLAKWGEGGISPIALLHQSQVKKKKKIQENSFSLGVIFTKLYSLYFHF